MTPVIAPTIRYEIQSELGRVFENAPAQTRMQEVPQDVWQVIGGRVAAIVATAELAARDVVRMSSVCRGLQQASHAPAIQRVITQAKNEDDALLKIWTKISGNLKFNGNPPPQTLVEIKAWFEDPTNAVQLNAITELVLDDLQLKAIPPQITKFTQLKELLLSNNQIVDISALRGLTQLNTLYLVNNQIVDISALTGLNQLKNLCLDNNQIVDISALRGFTQLKTLTLDKNQIVDISALWGLSQLKTLRLSNNRIVDISALGGLTQVSTLYLMNNQIVDISALGWLTQMRFLFLNYNQIVDISALGGLTWLNTVSLIGNQIAVIPALRKCDFLISLYIANNPITDITSLMELTALQWAKIDSHYLLFVFNDNSPGIWSRSELDVIVEKNIVFKDYSCKSSLSSFVQFLALGNPELEAIKTQFSKLDDSDKNLIYALVSQASAVMTDDPNWGEHHAFDDKIVLVQAVRKAIRTKFEQLSQDQKNQVYGEVYKLAGSPQTKDSQQWGEHHAFDNVLLLIDAMKKLDQQFLAFPA